MAKSSPLPSTIALPSIGKSVRPAEFLESRPAVLTVSYPRSGTHFLMNALANCYGYVSNPWINLDHDTANLNYFHPASIGEFLLALAARPVATIVKSHHAAEFFGDELARLGARWVMVVPVRHPVQTLLSYWRFLNGLSWFEGPRVADPFDFFRAAPCGGMMRYQTRQFPSMMLLWADWIEGWLAAAKKHRHVAVVRYEDLSSKFDETVRTLAPLLGREPTQLSRPDRENSAWVRVGAPSGDSATDLEGLRALCRQTVGKTMDLLGYE